MENQNYEAEKFIQSKYPNKYVIDWNKVLTKFTVDTNFLEDYKAYIDWREVWCRGYMLTTSFILNNIEKVDFDLLLTPTWNADFDIIEQNKDKLQLRHWNKLLKLYDVPNEFILNHIDKLDLRYCNNPSLLSRQVINKYLCHSSRKKKLPWIDPAFLNKLSPYEIYETRENIPLLSLLQTNVKIPPKNMDSMIKDTIVGPHTKMVRSLHFLKNNKLNLKQLDQIYSRLAKLKHKIYTNLFVTQVMIHRSKISPTFIKKYQNEINWSELLRKRTFNEDEIKRYIKQYIKYISIDILLNTQSIPDDLIGDIIDRIHPSYRIIDAITEKQIDSIIQSKKMNIEQVFASNRQFSEKFIKKYANQLPVYTLCKQKNVPFKLFDSLFPMEASEIINFLFNIRKIPDWYIKKNINQLTLTHYESLAKQPLSNELITLFPQLKTSQYIKSHVDHRSLHIKKTEMIEYAKKYNLIVDGDYIYAYRIHNNFRGYFNRDDTYKYPGIYRDWRCDLDKEQENSFGLGIFPTGNTKVRVHYKDWGVEVGRNDGKARVFAFELLPENFENPGELIEYIFGGE